MPRDGNVLFTDGLVIGTDEGGGVFGTGGVSLILSSLTLTFQAKERTVLDSGLKNKTLRLGNNSKLMPNSVPKYIAQM